MSSLNDLALIEKAMSPEDIIKLRATFPTLLEALRIQQTVINQIITRIGGSGSGSGVVNLIEINELSSAADMALPIADEAKRDAMSALTLVPDNVMAHIAELRASVEYLTTLCVNDLLIAEIANLKNRVEAIEHGISYA
jgi:hypothetical protein